ncbi:MAG TPA: ABC transporter permease subunit [Anaerolineae bacterium]|nr:ABC transporter permease subunit [Anaerolineae bacterium]HPL29940.1 ABC transporter permease subunit [Anaerolineae bacterium]
MKRIQIVRIILIVVAAFVIFGPLSSLVIWSVAEKWYWPHLLPQQVGGFYWAKVFQGRMVQSLEVGVLIAVVVTALSLLFTVPLGYVLARFQVPFKALVLLIFMLPQAFPQLPVFANATVYLYRWNMGAKVSGVILIQMVGALVYAVWTMTAVFKSIPVSLEEAAINLGASRIRTFFNVSLPLAIPGIIASGLLVFLYSLDEFTGTLLVGSPFVLTLPVFMYNASQGYELPVASITALLLMVPGIVLLLVMERYLKAEYLSSFGRI